MDVALIMSEAKITQPVFNCAIASSVSALIVAEPFRIESAVDVVPVPLATSYMSAQRSGRAGGPPPPPEGDDELSSLLSDLDTDGDGLVSKAEFVAGRPSDVSEDQAGTLFDSFDSESAGSLSVDALTEAMSAQSSQRPEGPPPPPPADDEQTASLLSDLDTDGDGLVSLDEFMAGRPDDVTESQASQLFDLLDTSGSGSLSASTTS